MIPVIIVNWNGWDDTLECIESTVKTIDINYHIHLIDNGSDNNEGHKLSTLYRDIAQVTVHQYDQNYGFTGAHLKIWNELLCHQDHTHIALLNNDTTVDPQWLYQLHQMAIAKNCGITCAKMIQYYDRSIMDNAGHKMLNTGEILPIGHGEPIGSYTQSFKNMGGCGGAVLYSTNMIRKIGFFDDYFSTGYEDAELGLRAIVSGYESWYAPDAIIYHKGGQSIKKVFNEAYSTMIFTAILYSYFKNLSLIDLIINFPFLIFKYFCIVIIDILTLRWKYLRIMLRSVYNTIRDARYIRQKRTQIPPSKVGVTTQFDFFLWFDIKRFIRLALQSERKSAMDTYRIK